MESSAERPPSGPRSILDGRYELVLRLQHTGDGDTFRARDLLLDRVVTVLVRDGDGDADRDDTRWARETGALRELDHAHIAELCDGGFVGGDSYTVLRVAGARTLEDEIARGRVGAARAARWSRDLTDGLEYLHRRGLAHRAVGADSVLLDDTATARWFRFSSATAPPAPEQDRDADLRGMDELTATLAAAARHARRRRWRRRFTLGTTAS